MLGVVADSAADHICAMVDAGLVGVLAMGV